MLSEKTTGCYSTYRLPDMRDAPTEHMHVVFSPVNGWRFCMPTYASVQVEVRPVTKAACHRLVDAQQLRRVTEQRLVRLKAAEQLLALHRLRIDIRM